MFLLACMLNFAALVLMFQWGPNPDEAYLFFIISAMWNIADSVWQTQINGKQSYSVFLSPYCHTQASTETYNRGGFQECNILEERFYKYSTCYFFQEFTESFSKEKMNLQLHLPTTSFSKASVSCKPTSLAVYSVPVPSSTLCRAYFVWE